MANALAVVVAAVRDPDMDDKFVSMRFGVVHDRISHEILYLPTGVTKIGVQRHAVE